VPFTNVNDGVCDYELCCDGSDEWEGVGGIKCEDRCAKIGKEWKKQDEIRQKSLGNANRRRKELVAEAGRLRKQVEDRIQTLQAQIKGQEVKVEALSKTLADVERSEKGKVVRGAGKGGKLGVLTSLAKDKVNDLTDSLRTVKDERDAAKSKITELEAILKRFKEEYNPNFNDEGVKRAVKAWEDYAASQPVETDGSARDRDLEDLMNPSSESAIKWDEYEDNEESDVELRRPPPSHATTSLTSHQCTDLKNTSRPRSAPGSTKSSAPYASPSSRTVSSQTPTPTPPNPSVLPTRASNSAPRRALSTATAAS
jgi:protein kinase C substrate 80K-H